MRTLLRSAILMTLFAFAAGAAAAQESPFVSKQVFEILNGELSGDVAYDHLRHLTLYHSPEGGSRGFRDKMRWIAAKAKEVGLEDVRIIDDIPMRGVGWTPLAADLWIVAPEKQRIISYDEAAVAIADYSRSGTWEGELVDVGEGSSDADYAGKDVKGKIVLVSGSAGSAMDQAVWKRGALGIVSYNPLRGISYPDQVSWTRLSSRPPEGRQNTFAFSISYRMAMQLKQRLAPRPKSGGDGMDPGEKIVVRATVEAEWEQTPKQWIVEGWIRGASIKNQAIILTAHAQEEKYSANDDNSGCANLIEMGRTLAKLIREGRLQRPARDIRFWWVNEIDAEYEYFAMHPEERGTMLLNLHQDMVGAKQSAGSRIQHIIRTPWSRPSYVNAVVESIATMVMQGNSAYLAAGQAGTTQPYSRAILSRFGTRERYGMEVVPYFGSSDHLVFNDSIIGIPGVGFINWPDDFIHSSDDDLWQMDATQLKRNAFIITAAAWYFATLAPEGVPVLAAQVNADSRKILGDSTARATEILLLAAPAEREAAFLDGANLIENAAGVAAASLGSVRVFLPEAEQKELASQLMALAGSAFGELEQYAGAYQRLTGKEPPDPALSEEEKAWQKKIPEVALGVKDYLYKREDVSTRGIALHTLMRYEVWNFVDGRRSYLDIFRAVKAEAQSAGAWYYGTVTAKDVGELLDRGVKAGILRLK